MTDYSKFDRALLVAIISKPKSFAELTTARQLIELAQSLEATDRRGLPADIDRIFDRRLQALRRAGKIRYSSRRGWEVVERD